MRIGVDARGTHSLHLERGFDTLKRNLSLESRSNIKSWFRVCLWRIRHYDEPIIPKRFLLLLFLTFKNPIFTIKLSSNHLLKVNRIEQLPVGTILSFYYFGKTVHLRFYSSVRCLRTWEQSSSLCKVFWGFLNLHSSSSQGPHKSWDVFLCLICLISSWITSRTP